MCKWINFCIATASLAIMVNVSPSSFLRLAEVLDKISTISTTFYCHHGSIEQIFSEG